MELKRYFWKRVVAGFTAGLMLATGLFLGTISVSAQTTLQQAVEQQQVEDIAAKLIDGPNSYSKQGHKALVLHDEMLDLIQPADTGSTAYDALVEHTANSQGYAQAMALLLEKVGLEHSLAQDPATGEMWNRVKIDGSWYNLSVYRDDRSGRRTAFLKSDAAFSVLLGSSPSSWTGENSCTNTYYDNWFLNQSRDGGDVWKGELYYTNGSGTLYAGFLMGTSTAKGLNLEQTGLDRVDACATFDNVLYLIGSKDGQSQGLYRYNGSSGAITGGEVDIRQGSVTATGQDIGSKTIVEMYSNSTGLVLVAEDGSTRTVTLHTHTLGDWQAVQQPVCVPGKEVRRCTSCGEEVEVRYQLPVHSYSAGGTVLTSPTLEQPGTMVKTCADCQTEVILPLSYGDVDLSGDVAVTDVMTLAQAVVNSNPLPEGIDGNFDQSTETPTKLGVLDVMALATYVVNH